MLDKWVEVGNSGMFRPEMLERMGFPKHVRVHGWGLSLERPTMIRCVPILILYKPYVYLLAFQLWYQQHQNAGRPQGAH